MAVPLVNTVLLQGIRLASAATARFSTTADSADRQPAEHSQDEVLDEEIGLHRAPTEPQNDGPNSAVHAVVSVAGDSRFGSEVTSDRSRLADVTKVGQCPHLTRTFLLTLPATRVSVKL